MPDITELKDLNKFSQSNPNTLIILNFKASWCGPCKSVKPFINYLKEEYDMLKKEM